MNYSGMRMHAALTAYLALMACGATAQDVAKLPYMNPSLPPERRAADLVHRMTLEEKASQLVNQARAIPRLKVPAYDWWSEALHGVAVDGTTEFPEPIGLAATFDVPAIHTMAIDISIEGRIKHALAERAGHSDIFEGLDFWAPNVNIFRDPRWGRGQETYGDRLCHGHAGYGSPLLPRHLDAQAFCRAQRPGAYPPLRRRGCQQARRGRHVSAGVSRRRRGGARGFRDVRIQFHQR
jgi:hypothetical protein